jgi:hypothetical protein
MSKYTLTSLKRSPPPEGASNKPWYQFIIENDTNTITSLRCGSEYEVQQVAVNSVNRLNEKCLSRLTGKNYSRPVYEINTSAYL